VVAQLGSAARPIIVVTGHQAGRIRAVLRQAFGPALDLRCVHNRHYRDGMAGSLQRGIGALPPWTTKALLCLGDMPGVDAHLVRRLFAAWRPDLDVVRPVHLGRPGHPVLVGSHLFDAFETLAGDRGAKAILETVPAARRKHIGWHAGCILDTDTPAAFRRAALWLQRSGGRVADISTIPRRTTWR
jgi:molybdenum cofactor cytidylyltransferase